MKRRYWNRAEITSLRSRYPHERTELIAGDLSRELRAVYQKARSLGLRKSATYLASEASGRLRRGSHPRSVMHQFPKGNVPWNKGTHWDSGGRSHETRFKKGQMPHNADPEFYVLGALRWNDDGYLEMRVSFQPGSRGWRGMHSILWEDAHGAIPSGCAVCFRDRDQTNVELANLELVSRAELMRRNTIHRLPPELKSTVHLLGQLKRRIRERAERNV